MADHTQYVIDSNLNYGLWVYHLREPPPLCYSRGELWFQPGHCVLIQFKVRVSTCVASSLVQAAYNVGFNV